MMIDLLKEQVSKAIEAYPASERGIRKGMRLVLAGKVALSQPREAFVASQGQEGVWYRVHAGKCSCVARTPLCAHRWAVTLLRRVIAAMDEIAAVKEERWYALYQDGKGDHLEVIVAKEETGAGYIVYAPSGEPLCTNVPEDMVVLLGRCDLSDAQRLLDGDLVKKACGMVEEA